MVIRAISDPAVRRDHPGIKDYPKITLKTNGYFPADVLDICSRNQRVPVAYAYNVEFDTYTVWCLPRDRKPKEA